MATPGTSPRIVADAQHLRILVILGDTIVVDVDRKAQNISISAHNEIMETGASAYSLTWAPSGGHSVSIDYYVDPLERSRIAPDGVEPSGTASDNT